AARLAPPSGLRHARPAAASAATPASQGEGRFQATSVVPRRPWEAVGRLRAAEHESLKQTRDGIVRRGLTSSLRCQRPSSEASVGFSYSGYIASARAAGAYVLPRWVTVVPMIPTVVTRPYPAPQAAPSGASTSGSSSPRIDVVVLSFLVIVSSLRKPGRE